MARNERIAALEAQLASSRKRRSHLLGSLGKSEGDEFGGDDALFTPAPASMSSVRVHPHGAPPALVLVAFDSAPHTLAC